MASTASYIVGNWKMNGSAADVAVLQAIAEAAAANDHVVVGICPPATLIAAFAAAAGKVQIGAQDCHAKASGAHTGNLSAAMIREAGFGLVKVRNLSMGIAALHSGWKI